MLAEQATSAPATAANAPSTAAPANVIQRKPGTAAAQSMEVGPGTTVEAAAANSGAQSPAGGGAEPESWWWPSATTCPPTKVTSLGSVDSSVFYWVEAGMISCTIFVKYDYSSQTKKDYLDRLERAVKDPGSVCIKFDSNMSDPDCKVPREVDDVSDRK